jgi:hypothetical protein
MAVYKCQLTFKKDRLIAISGIAQSLQERYDDEYVAGLWKKDLRRQMSWYFWGTLLAGRYKRASTGPS